MVPPDSDADAEPSVRVTCQGGTAWSPGDPITGPSCRCIVDVLLQVNLAEATGSEDEVSAALMALEGEVCHPCIRPATSFIIMRSA